MFVVFTTWSLVAFLASPVAKRATQSDDSVHVVHGDGVWAFTPADSTRATSTGLMFIAGALVDPRAYAPLMRAVAIAGHPAYIIELPRRGAFGGATATPLIVRIESLLRDTAAARQWVIGGHSRGGVVASSVMTTARPSIAGMVLVGTSHPRDVDLSSLTIPVTKVAGTRDGLASRKEVEANARLLPPSTTWVWVEGGNHSQFGWYGFQPGDRPPRIAAEAQREEMIRAVLASLARADGPRP